MRLMFVGADHEVTGSCHYLSANGKHMIIDCGMQQGEDIFDNQKLPVNASLIDYVFITHAHIDHTGLLPLLYKDGFRGKVFGTKPTCDLCNIMLRDSAHIQMFEAEWRNRKAKRSGQEEFVPIYSMEDAEGIIQLLEPCFYETSIEVFEGIQIRFRDVGHLLGSSSIEVTLTEKDIQKKIVFSGDIGNLNQPIIKDPKYFTEADYVVMESTYGDRNHERVSDDISELAKIIQSTFDKGGNVIIPSFAVGRTQEMLYFIRKIKEEKLVQGHGEFDVYVDSPLANEATTIFEKNVECCFDEEAMELVRKGINPIHFPGLKTSVTSDDSKAINEDLRPKVIISASGMCEAGRIRHHLKHNLWRRECTILFVGYQAVGTLGRNILDGATVVKLFGETVEVNAQIQRLNGISGHADREGLLKWLFAFEKKPERVFVVHGDDLVSETFVKSLKEEYDYNAVAPYSGAVYDLTNNSCVKEGIPKPVVAMKPAMRHASEVYSRLVKAGQRLMEVIKHNQGGANKDLAKFADQINAICDKWDR